MIVQQQAARPSCTTRAKQVKELSTSSGVRTSVHQEATDLPTPINPVPTTVRELRHEKSTFRQRVNYLSKKLRSIEQQFQSAIRREIVQETRPVQGSVITPEPSPWTPPQVGAKPTQSRSVELQIRRADFVASPGPVTKASTTGKDSGKKPAAIAETAMNTAPVPSLSLCEATTPLYPPGAVVQRRTVSIPKYFPIKTNGNSKGENFVCRKFSLRSLCATGYPGESLVPRSHRKAFGALVAAGNEC